MRVQFQWTKWIYFTMVLGVITQLLEVTSIEIPNKSHDNCTIQWNNNWILQPSLITTFMASLVLNLLVLVLGLDQSSDLLGSQCPQLRYFFFHRIRGPRTSSHGRMWIIPTPIFGGTGTEVFSTKVRLINTQGEQVTGLHRTCKLLQFFLGTAVCKLNTHTHESCRWAFCRS